MDDPRIKNEWTNQPTGHEVAHALVGMGDHLLEGGVVQWVGQSDERREGKEWRRAPAHFGDAQHGPAKRLEDPDGRTDAGVLLPDVQQRVALHVRHLCTHVTYNLQHTHTYE
jgi:hypothetical protein